MRGLRQIKTRSSVCTELPVTKCLHECDLAGLTRAASRGGWLRLGMGFSMHGCVTEDKPLPSLDLCFLPPKRMIPGPHPALPFSESLSFY